MFSSDFLDFLGGFGVKFGVRGGFGRASEHFEAFWINLDIFQDFDFFPQTDLSVGVLAGLIQGSLDLQDLAGRPHRRLRSRSEGLQPGRPQLRETVGESPDASRMSPRCLPDFRNLQILC